MSEVLLAHERLVRRSPIWTYSELLEYITIFEPNEKETSKRAITETGHVA